VKASRETQVYAQEQVQQPRKQCQWPELEDKPVNWIEDQRQFGYIVTANMFQIKALAMIDEPNITGFQAFNNWCTQFLRRNNLALRQRQRLLRSCSETKRRL